MNTPSAGEPLIHPRTHPRFHATDDTQTRQERFLHDAGQQGVKRADRTYYMPTDSDVAVRAFRRWFNSRGGGGVTWAKVSKRRKGGKNGRDDATLFCAHTTLGSMLRFVVPLVLLIGVLVLCTMIDDQGGK